MSLQENVHEERPQLKVIEGGKALSIPPQPAGRGPREPTDYLTPMGIGCVFLVKPNRFNTFLCLEFTIKDTSEKSIELFSDMWYMIGIGSQEEEYSFWVSPLEFCISFDLVDILKEGSHE